MSDTNTSTIAYRKEASLGVAQTTGLRKARHTGGDTLATNLETVESAEIRDDRATSDLTLVHSEPTGGFSFEGVIPQLYDFLEMQFLNEFTKGNVTINITIDEPTQTVTAVAGTFSDVIAGCQIRIAGATDPLDNGLKRVVSKSVDSSTLTLADGSILNDEAITDADVDWCFITKGLKATSTTFQKTILAGGEYHNQHFVGMVADTMNLKFASKAIVDGDISFIGMSSGKTKVPTVPSFTAEHEGSVINATSNVSKLEVSDVIGVSKYKTINLSMSNGLRGRDCIGGVGNFDIGLSTFKITGDFSTYFMDNKLLAHADVNGSIAIEWTVGDAEGNLLSFRMGKVKFQNANANIEAKDSDVMVNAPYTAIYDSATSEQIIVDCFVV